MATQADVRRIARALPGTEESTGAFAFSVPNKGKRKAYIWVWNERVEPKKPRVPNPAVLAVRVPNLEHKATLISADPVTFFTEPHYNGFPAVLVRLQAIRVANLRVLLEDAWRCVVPRELTGAKSIRTASRKRDAERSKRAPATKRPRKR